MPIELSEPKKTAATVLETAHSYVGGDRQNTHGDKLVNHQNIATLWDGYLRNKLRSGTPGVHDGTSRVMPEVTALDVANMMELLKIARRQVGAHNFDDYIDGAGYAAVAGEIAERMDV